MKTFRFVFLIPALLFITGLPGLLLAQQIYTINSFIDPPVQQEHITISGAEQQRTYFEINDELFIQQLLAEGDILEFRLPESEISELEITRVSQHIPGLYSYIANDPADPWRSMAFTYSDGRLLGTYHRSDHSAYFIEYDSETGLNYMSNISYQDDIQFCGVHDEIKIPAPSVVTQTAKTADTHQLPAPSFEVSQALMDDFITIDLMIPYTRAARNYAENQSGFDSIEALIAQSMNISQLAIDNSNLAMDIRLVHFYETGYDDDESVVTAVDHLRRLTRNPESPLNFCSPNDNQCDESDWDGYMEEVHELRDQYGADLVALYASEPNTGGIAWLMTSIAGRQDLAFSVNRVQQATSTETVIHEIGHNMGLAHSRTQFSNAAGMQGGVFEFSTGHQFQADDESFATVMAYEDSNAPSRVAVFSSPDIEFAGGITGTVTRNNGGPSNNVKSLNLMKRTIASYRLTKVDPPVTNLSRSDITVNMNREDQRDELITITNNGDSGYAWDIDFRFAETVGKMAKASTSNSVHTELQSDKIEVDEIPALQHITPSFNLNDDIVYSTIFSPDEGFETGKREVMESWSIFVAGDLTIDNSNPSVGSNHLRMESLGSGNNIVVSPYFGPQSFSKYEVTFDVYIPNDAPSRGADFVFYAFDTSTPNLVGGFIRASAGIYFQNNGNIFLRGQGSSDDGNWFNGGAFGYGQYNSVKIIYNTDNETLDYYLNDQLRGRFDYIDLAGYRPDQFWFRHLNNDGARWDIDNVKVRRLATPTSWLTVGQFGGVLEPDGSSILNLSFNTEGMDAGTYELVMFLRGNDPEQTVYEIPVTLEVNEAVSLEGGTENPVRTQLVQNYPNPFNPVTNIQYKLAENEHVTLSVYDITGRRVATLVNEQKTAGEYQVRFDASHLSSGVYIYRLQTSTEILTRQMVLIK